MDAHTGLNRIATVIHVVGAVIAAVMVIASISGGSIDQGLIAAVTIYGLAFALAWIVRGFAGKESP
ncbi:MAG: hypothetical protein KF822_09645 [Steroidobacteraceae bacterium]|nr:hypothetical protein [Steroidobacteraceae bacterium]